LPSPRGSFRVWQRNVTIFRKYWKSIMAPNFVEPLLYLAALGLGLGAFIQQGGINGQSYIQYIAPGLLASNAMFAASFESTFNTFVKLKIDRIYDAIITTPVNAEDVVAGEYLWAGTRAALYGTGFLAVLTVLGSAFGEPLITSWWALLIPPMLLIIGIMFSVMGTLFTSLIERIDLYSYYFTLVVTPLFLFSGIFFPVEDFPAPVPQIAWFTPLYHAVNVCRELATGPSPAVLVDLAWIVVFTLVLALVPVQIMRRRLIG
jgi:lipooligosaccharide transport system permease protein